MRLDSATLADLRAPLAAPEMDAQPTGDDGLPEWLHLVPYGVWAGHSSGRLSLSEQDGQQIVANFAADRIMLAVDYEHQTLHAEWNGQPAPAAGWVDRLELRADGVWGHVERWTPRAQEMLRAREYRYLSPVIQFGAADRRTGLFAGTRLLPAALTNMPFLAGALAPVVNADPHAGATPMRLPMSVLALLALTDTPDPTPEAIDAAATKAAAEAELGRAAQAALGVADPAAAQAALRDRLAGSVALRDHLEALAAAHASAPPAETDAALLDRVVAEGRLVPAMRDQVALRLGQPGTRALPLAWLRELPVTVPVGVAAARGPGARPLQPPGSVATEVARQIGVDPTKIA